MKAGTGCHQPEAVGAGDPTRVRSSGFSLPEVLVALVIFAMAAVVLGSAYVNILQGYEIAGRAAEDDPDIAFARQQLLTQTDLPTAEKGDEFDGAGGRHVSWSAAITQADTTDLFTVGFTCEVADPAAKGPKKVVQTFMLLRPTWSDPTDRTNLRQAAANRIAKLQGKQQ
jgi:general secretion pathway protein I